MNNTTTINNKQTTITKTKSKQPRSNHMTNKYEAKQTKKRTNKTQQQHRQQNQHQQHRHHQPQHHQHQQQTATKNKPRAA